MNMSASVSVDGKKLSLNPFMASLTANVIQAIAKSLKASNAAPTKNMVWKKSARG